MDRSVYARMNEQEAEHWWFKARRDIIRSAMQRIIPLPEHAAILEAGCGTGGNLQMLSEFGEVDAFEFDDDARATAEAKSGVTIPFGALPTGIPFEGKRYDLVGLFDVLEHVEDDCGSLRALGDHLTDDGVIFVTVPAFQWLWSKHDVSHHHFRRYCKASLSRTAKDAGLEVVQCGYFNSFLLPVAVGMRALKKLVGSEAPDDTMPAPGLNRALYNVFSSERHLLGRVRMPAGLSVMAILRKRKPA
ncbi:methyltransferase family protein [Litoreibacter meonggei]|uniref:Methyltransferase family protein n=1 Tax=Litoreibacter meonggei TaxID=1049199 RepID=A0A497X134_9RHOB|nr:class I SAM-dependent methyltransferase [Litoreibacter meonggei]RLJ59185.1 methyltransferase family protein [Litoreibacter meonggei]